MTHPPASSPAAPPPAPYGEPPPAIRVFIVDDHNLFRRGLCAVLAAEPEFDCVGEAGSGPEAVSLAPAARPDLVLMDLAMPGMDGVATMDALRGPLPLAGFVILTCTLDAAALRRVHAAGAACVLPKTTSPQELLTVLHAAYRGRCVYSPAVADAIAADSARRRLGADLTRSERRLLTLMARGLNNRDIGARLDIAMPTVKFHVTNILAKMEAGNRTAAVLKALRHQLVALDEPAGG